MGKLIFSILLLLGGYAHAQTVPDTSYKNIFRAGALVETNLMHDSLQLTTLQTPEVYTINHDYFEKLAVARQQHTPAEMPELVTIYTNEWMEQLQTKLTATQMQRLRELLKRRALRRQGQ
jgi:hypothetical protein